MRDMAVLSDVKSDKIDWDGVYKLLESEGYRNIDAWAMQILYWRSHLDVFIEDILSPPDQKIKLEGFQKVICRRAGDCTILQDNESRGLGKTWKMGLILFALGILYPGSKVLIASNSAAQAINTINYINGLANNNPNMEREIADLNISVDYAVLKFKNGTEIKAKAMGKGGDSLLGGRAKIIFIDESVLVDSFTVSKALRPILNYRRPVWWAMRDYGFEDYQSKMFEATSAYLRGTDYYQDRMKPTFKAMCAGDTKQFASCISYETGLRLGMIDIEKLETDRASMSEDIFEMEYGCVFKGSSNSSYLPFELTNKSRVLETIELHQPKNSTARYIASLDVATSNKQSADNAVLTVLKFFMGGDGKFVKQVVYIKAFKGMEIRWLAAEVRKIMIRFPAVEKVIIDANAIGEGVVSSLGDPYIDKDSGREYPPLVEDTIDVSLYDTPVNPIIWGFRGNNALNNRGVVALRSYFENGTLQLPVSSMNFRGSKDGDKQMLIEEASVFANADALIVEMSNVRPYVINTGVKYDVPHGKHKDRFSSLMMACLYVYNLEERLREERRSNTGESCMGLTFRLARKR